MSQSQAMPLHLHDAQREAMDILEQRVAEFASLEEASLPEPMLYHRVLAGVHQICDAILACEEIALTRREIVTVLEPVRTIHRRSPFVARLQTWPRGYPGDFETVEYLLSAENRAEDKLARACEAYALSRSIAQQHRNKVRHQAARLLAAMQASPGRARIASIACGSCADLRSIVGLLPPIAGELFLNDLDVEALAFSRRALEPIAGHCHFRHADALSFVRRLERGTLDLVLAGGLFDYLDDRTASLLIQLAYRALAPGGTFFFTNIAEGNPYRALIEYFGDWKLIERSEDQILETCERAGIGRGNVFITREETGLTLLIEITKLE
jgi:extracellular factor (EF) 3-hydroxypalmitic acid methyl ester biosynthesis protein